MSNGEKIKQARISKNMSQEDLASMIGVSRQAISKWESDKAVPTGLNRDCLNKVLEISLEVDEKNTSINDKKYKILLIGGWLLAIVLLIATIILSVNLYQTRKLLRQECDEEQYLPEETITENDIPEMDSDCTTYNYYVED